LLLGDKPIDLNAGILTVPCHEIERRLGGFCRAIGSSGGLGGRDCLRLHVPEDEKGHNHVAYRRCGTYHRADGDDLVCGSRVFPNPSYLAWRQVILGFLGISFGCVLCLLIVMFSVRRRAIMAILTVLCLGIVFYRGLSAIWGVSSVVQELLDSPPVVTQPLLPLPSGQAHPSVLSEAISCRS
jgi:hypothetical protein